MSLERPWALLLLLTPLLAWFWWQLGESRLRVRRERWTDGDLLRRLALQPGAAEHRGTWALLACLALVSLALAGPGGRPRQGPTSRDQLVLVLDLSRSMQVQDGTETRLARARRFLEVLVEAWLPLHPGGRVGLVGFAEDAVTLCPLTVDPGAVSVLLAQVERRQDRLAPGTNLERALAHAASLLPGQDGQIVLVSDGEALSGQAVQQARQLARRGLHLVVAGVGGSEPMPVPGAPDLFGRPRPHLAPDGQPAVSRADPRALAELARQAGGFHAPLRDPEDVGPFLARLPAGGAVSGTAGRSWGALPVAVALLWLGVQAWRDPRLRLLLWWTPILVSLPGCDVRMAREAARLHAEGKPRAALERLGSAGAGRPAWWHQDRGCSLFALGRHDEAIAAFERAASAPEREPRRRSRRLYNLASALIHRGAADRDPSLRWRQAASHLEQALSLDPTDEDARANLDWLRQRLEKGSGGGASSRPEEKGASQGARSEPTLPEDEIRSALEMLEREERQFLESRTRPERALDPWGLDDRPPSRPDW